MEDQNLMIRVQDVKKQYRLGQIGGGTLRGDLQSWWARKRGKEDPNTQIGTDQRLVGTTFMALNGVSFTVNKGEAVGIIGSNGAGKSTLLKLLTHVTAPTSGDIDLYGRVASMLEVGTGFHPEMTGRENVYLNGAILGMTRAEIDAKMDQIIEFSECGDFIDTPVKRYSSGMFVKLAFSVAAHLDSEIMIMDEVLAVGDMKFQKKCLDKMKEAATRDGRTVLYVSHNMATIRQLCDRCIVLDKGKIIYDGEVEQAIRIYMGGDGQLLPVHYDMREAQRPPYGHGKQLFITDVDLCGKERACYSPQEPLRLRLRFEARNDLKDLKLYFHLHTTSGEVVGTTQAYTPFAKEVKKGKHYTVELQMDISNLADGSYWFYTDVFSADEHGTHYSYDLPMREIRFDMLDEDYHGLVWASNYFGYIRLGELKPMEGSLCCEEDQG